MADGHFTTLFSELFCRHALTKQITLLYSTAFLQGEPSGTKRGKATGSTLSDMILPMLNEAGFVAKALPTFTTLIRSFFRVGSLVSKKCKFQTEGFPAFTARIRPLPSVHSLV